MKNNIKQVLQYSEIFHFLLSHLHIFDAPSLKYSKKNIKKHIFDVKLPVLSNATGRIGLTIEERLENRKNAQLLKKS